jgi:hypothetical protein
VNAPSEVGHSKDHNNHSPFHRVVLALHATNFGAGFLLGHVHLLWSDVVGRVPTKTLLVVIIMTPVSILLVIDWIC